MKKNRTPIPTDTANRVLFLSHRTCCVCRDYGREVQVHHIDENPSNNNEDNLAVLCLICHNETITTGGFGRRLNRGQIKLYRDEWVTTVAMQKEETIRRAVLLNTLQLDSPEGDERSSAIADLYKHASSLSFNSNEEAQIIQLLSILPQKYCIILVAARQQMEAGTTYDMVIGSKDIIHCLKTIFIEILHWWPESFFSEGGIENYVDKMVYDTAHLYRTILEPEGPGTGGTIVGPMAGGLTIEDLQAKVPTMAKSLLPLCTSFDFKYWIRAWDAVCKG